MPPLAPPAFERRFDFRKGLNTTATDEVADSLEVRRAKNLLPFEHGGFITRAGSQRVHLTALNGPVIGLFQWDAPAGKQLVAVAGGRFYTKQFADAEFTQRAVDLSAVTRPQFAVFRTGATLSLYIAQDTLYRWDGTTFSAVAGAPAGRLIRDYKGRMFLSGDPAFPKRVRGSRIGDPADWNAANGALTMDAEQYDNEAVAGFAKVGSSLLIYKPDACQRFTGVSAEDMNLDRDSEGVSRTVGCVAPGTIVELETLVYALTDDGVYVFTEGGHRQISEQIDADLRRINKTAWQDAVAVYCKETAEYRLFVPLDAQTDNLTGYFYNRQLGTWTGPHEGWNVSAAARYERSTGKEAHVYGSPDGFVREAEVGVLDDVLQAGGGGNGIAWDAVFPTLHFGSPGVTKDLETLHGTFDLAAAQQATAYLTADGSAEVTGTLASVGAGVFDYDFGAPGLTGNRFTLGFRGVATARIRFRGFELEASVLGRR